MGTRDEARQKTRVGVSPNELIRGDLNDVISDIKEPRRIGKLSTKISFPGDGTDTDPSSGRNGGSDADGEKMKGKGRKYGRE